MLNSCQMCQMYIVYGASRSNASQGHLNGTQCFSWNKTYLKEKKVISNPKGLFFWWMPPYSLTNRFLYKSCSSEPYITFFLSWLFVFWKMQTIYRSYCSSCRLDNTMINDTGNICGFCRAVGVRGNIKVTWVRRVSEHNRWVLVLDLTLYVGNQTVSRRPKETSRLSKEYFLTLGDMLGLYWNVGFVLYIFTEKKRKNTIKESIAVVDWMGTI